MNKKRVLILAQHFMSLYSFRRELIERLCRDGHEVYLSLPESDDNVFFENLGCKIVPTEINRRGVNPIEDLKLILFYHKTIAEVRPEIVLSYTIKPNVYGGIVCQWKKIPYIANITGLGTSIENGGLLSKISITLYKLGLKKAKCVFFQNRDNQRFFVDRGVVKGKNRLIPGSGVNLEAHNFEPYPSDENGIRFLFVGRIMKNKGIEELLSATMDIHSKRKDVVLDVVGFFEEDYTEALGKAEKKGAVIYHGRKSDVHPFYKACHCAVLPSYYEGMSNVMLEASATGRPVITTLVPGCQETFDEGITGFGCEAREADSLKDAMLHFLSLSQSEREKMGNAAHEKMVREFDRKIVVEAYMEEIDTIFRH